MNPQRIQLSRAAGFNLQEFSLALNGRRAIKVDRTTKWGNPYKVDVFGLDLALELFSRTARGIWTPSGVPDALVENAYKLHSEFLKRHAHHPLDNARFELRGYNLACWCHLGIGCHSETWLEIANA